MSAVLIRVALVVRDLLGVDEQTIRIGRQNYDQEDLTAAYIVIDGLGPAIRAASLETYDGTAEELSLGQIRKGPVTLDFYGTDAYTRAVGFCLRLRSQASRELQQANGITIYQPRSVTNLRALTGKQYSDRVQVETTVEISEQVTIDILRIDTAQLEIRNEEGAQNAG